MTHHQHSTPSSDSSTGTTRTAIGAAATILLAAIGGTAYLITQSSHTPPTPTQSAPGTRPEATTPTQSPATTPSTAPDKSTKPKPPPPDPG
jgi:hypothetical protein